MAFPNPGGRSSSGILVILDQGQGEAHTGVPAESRDSHVRQEVGKGLFPRGAGQPERPSPGAVDLSVDPRVGGVTQGAKG